MSLDDLPVGAPPRHEPEMVVRRVDRAARLPDKITRAEELRLQLTDDIVCSALPPGASLEGTHRPDALWSLSPPCPTLTFLFRRLHHL
jgi:hypothetical protein